ncbi:hypothetical protein ACFQ0G_12925 [Streptomyces chiangmaiensis]
MGLVVRVDGPADLRHPQRDAEVYEHREGVAELVAVEGALRLADHDGVEAAVRVAERLEEFVGAGRRCQGRERL